MADNEGISWVALKSVVSSFMFMLSTNLSNFQYNYFKIKDTVENLEKWRKKGKRECESENKVQWCLVCFLIAFLLQDTFSHFLSGKAFSSWHLFSILSWSVPSSEILPFPQNIFLQVPFKGFYDKMLIFPKTTVSIPQFHFQDSGLWLSTDIVLIIC